MRDRILHSERNVLYILCTQLLQEPPKGTTYNHLLGPPTGTTCRDHIQGPPTGTTYRDRLQGPPTGTTYRDRPQGPPIGTTHRDHPQGPPTGTTYRDLLQGPPTGNTDRNCLSTGTTFPICTCRVVFIERVHYIPQQTCHTHTVCYVGPATDYCAYGVTPITYFESINGFFTNCSSQLPLGSDRFKVQVYNHRRYTATAIGRDIYK